MRIGIIGHFGGNEKFNDGQTVKTIAIYDALKRYGLEDVDRIDTYYIKKNPFIFVSQFLNGGLRDKKIYRFAFVEWTKSTVSSFELYEPIYE